MPIFNSPPRLDLYSRSKVELWRVAVEGLTAATMGTDPLVQAGLHVVLAWLRHDARDVATLLELFGRPHGPLGQQLRMLGSLLDSPDPSDSGQLPPLWWQVVKAAYYARWLELSHAGKPTLVDTEPVS
jgi:hypothetical protein